MVQRVTVSKKLKPIKRTVNEAQSVPQREMVLRDVKGFTGKLPENGTLQVMQDLILAIQAAENAWPGDVFVHTASRGPSSPNSFEPTHFDVRT